MTSAIHLMQARDLASGVQAGALQISPALTVTMADEENVGMALFGLDTAREEACRQALAASAEILQGLGRLSAELAGESLTRCVA